MKQQVITIAQARELQKAGKLRLSSASSAKARNTVNGTILEETVDKFIKQSITANGDTYDVLYCQTKQGSKFRVNDSAIDILEPGIQVSIMKEESEIEGVMRHFFTFQSVVATDAKSTKGAKKAAENA